MHREISLLKELQIISLSTHVNQLTILIFKTTVESKKDITNQTPILNNKLFNMKWNFDLEDCDNILRVENSKTSNTAIVSIFNTVGFECIELV